MKPEPCSLTVCKAPSIGRLRGSTGAPFPFCAVHYPEYAAMGYKRIDGPKVTVDGQQAMATDA